MNGHLCGSAKVQSLPDHQLDMLTICFVLLFATHLYGAEYRDKVLAFRLDQLRQNIAKSNITAYLIPHAGDHQEEYPAPSDKRREFITGFTGSAGNALVTLNDAVLWSDSRYYTQAQNEIGPGWTFQKDNAADSVPSMKSWIAKNLKKGSRVGADPKKYTFGQWKEFDEALNPKGIELVALEPNLIDLIWENKPNYSSDPVVVHSIKFSGESSESKLNRVRNKLSETYSDMIVITDLDEIAWLLNLRGNDVPMTPVFISYLIVGRNFAYLYISKEKITTAVTNHLPNIYLREYHLFFDDLPQIIKNASRVFLPTHASQKIYSMALPRFWYTAESPIVNMKADKNQVEILNSRKAHVRDAVALCELYMLLEQQVPAELEWDELKVVQVLSELRSRQKWNKGEAFSTIAAFGKNGALPHYVPNGQTNAKIDVTAPLTIDSGGQYLDGTIDTTRVFHFGVPTEFQKNVYTALLKGVIDLANTVFPTGIKENQLSMILKRPLLQLGLTFGHGTTHGTGVYLNVHEEPGYYKIDDFGMRLENLVVVVKAEVQDSQNEKELLTFSTLTLVPYETKLINFKLLEKSQLEWLNKYHSDIILHVGSEMVHQGKHDLYKWLVEKASFINSEML